MVADLNGTVTVAAPLERAFEVFTKSFGTWWPSDYHIGEADIADVIIEPEVGGSEIEVRFTADGPSQTIVELEHRHLDRLVLGQALRDGINRGGGWTSLLEVFAARAAKEAS